MWYLSVPDKKSPIAFAGQKFENSLVFKRFSFQFISNYSSLYWIAFAKPHLTDPKKMCRPGYYGTQPDCMVELELQMMSLVISKASIQQFLEIALPWMTSTLKQIFSRRNNRRSDESSTESPSRHAALDFASSGNNRYVSESKLMPYNSTIEDFSEMVIQFGFLSLLGLSFPLTAFVNLLNNLVECRTDGFKILRLSQRTNASDAGDIGAWYAILQFLGILSVVTNAGLLIFTAKTVEYVASLYLSSQIVAVS
jgi:hypothetical protein